MIARRIAMAVVALGLFAVPYAITEPYYVNIASQILLYAVFAMGLNVLVGYAGLVSLGHAGLFGIAAYIVAYLLAAGYGHAFSIAAGAWSETRLPKTATSSTAVTVILQA